MSQATALPRVTDVDQLRTMLEMYLHSASELAADLRGFEGARAGELRSELREVRRIVEDEIDGGECDAERTRALVDMLSPVVTSCVRFVLADDVRRGVGEHAFELLGDSAVTIAELAMVAFARHIERVTDIDAFIDVEHRAPVPLMHACQQMLAAGFTEARLGATPPRWLHAELTSALLDEINDLDRYLDRTVLHGSPFTLPTVAALEVVAARWGAELEGEAGARHEFARADAIDATFERVQLQHDELDQLPDFAELFDLGHACALAEAHLEQLAREQDREAPGSAFSLAWIMLLEPGARITTRPRHAEHG